MTFFKRSKFAGFIGEKNKVPDGVWMMLAINARVELPLSMRNSLPQDTET